MSEVFFNEASVFFVGGRGDGSGGVTNAGGCTKVWWDAEVASTDEATALAKLMTSTGAPIVSDNGLAYTDADNRITSAGAFDDVEIGMVVYVIETPVPGTDIVTGRYKITDVAGGGDWIEINTVSSMGDADVDINIGGAFDELTTAQSVTIASDYDVQIYTNLNENLGLPVIMTAGGSVAKNIFKHIIGYNTTPGDMNRGGEYYESPFTMLLSGTINPAKTVTLDGGAGDFAAFNISGDNVVIENFHCTNTGTANTLVLNTTPDNIVFRNCRFTDGNFVISATSTHTLFDSCYSKNQAGNHYIFSGSEYTLMGCIGEVSGAAIFAVIPSTAGSKLLGCIVIGGARGMRIFSNEVFVNNCTFYGQSSYGIDMTTAAHATVFNTIFSLAPGTVAFNVTTSGSVISDYNCFIETDGSPLTIGAHDAGTAPVAGPHSILVDPGFVDAAAGNFRLQSDSPCRRVGRPTVGAT